MDNTVGAAAQRRRRRRKQLAIGLFTLLLIVGVAGSCIVAHLTQREGLTAIAGGTGAELKTVFVGPPELVVVWESVIGHAWAVSLVRGRIRNISDTTVSFEGITYSVKDEHGNVIWEGRDERFIMGGMIEPLGSIDFGVHPVAGTGGRVFELLVKGSQSQ